MRKAGFGLWYNSSTVCSLLALKGVDWPGFAHLGGFGSGIALIHLVKPRYWFFGISSKIMARSRPCHAHQR